ncbi:MAG: hypothetical protein ABR570_13525 [Burkholderiales bacterium]
MHERKVSQPVLRRIPSDRGAASRAAQRRSNCPIVRRFAFLSFRACRRQTPPWLRARGGFAATVKPGMGAVLV